MSQTKVVFFPKPDPNVFLVAARHLEDSSASRCGESIQKAFKQCYPNATTSVYEFEHINQVKQGFGHHPWFDGPTTEKNQKLRIQAMYMMAELCKAQH